MATYRVQLNKEFDFNKLKAILPYLAKLGISHIYASPIFQARRGSLHGYDVIDYDRISDDLGGRDAFEGLTKEAAACGLEWIQDIVPNHTSYSTENRIISDIMKQGAKSQYHGFPDVNWNHPSPKLRGRILAPFLDASYEESLKRRQITLAYNDGFVIRYKNLEFPVRLDSIRESASIERTIETYNKNTELLDELLSTQVFALDDWRMALREINYRRFFDIASMICLRTENMEVFDAVHRLVFELIKEGKISGLRVDHIDGLHNPMVYLERLRERAPKAYIVVEKILMRDENLPRAWSVQGTTGYDFLNRVNEVFVDTDSEKSFDRIYGEFTGNTDTYGRLLYKCKKAVVEEYFRGDMDNLARMLHQTLKKTAYGENYTDQGLSDAVAELFVCFPVYRTYVTEKDHGKEDMETLRLALILAKQRTRAAENELVSMEELFNENARLEDAVRFIMRLQQFTGAVMAKGCEDTALYLYNRLLSLNEVGGAPAKFGGSIEDFHNFNIRRQNQWPNSMNASSTHDTKRGEDVRARLNVLSEIPLEFGLQINKWAEFNRRKKEKLDGEPVPNGNEEYYLYQTLIGTFPFDPRKLPEFTERLKTHMVKAVREAKIHSSWLDPNSRYEEALVKFVDLMLQHGEENEFLKGFMKFQRKIAFYGCINSLSQTLLKITCPGVPDFYQGSELWDLNLVDPDNRRPVDFKERNRQLERLVKLESKPVEIQELLENFEDGTLKLYEIVKALRFRKANRELFEEGEYIPLEIKGTLKNHVIAFCRRKGTTCALIVVPRFLTSLMKAGSMIDSGVWKDTSVCLPANAPKKWREIFTERQLFSRTFGNHEGVLVGEILESFPTALLFSGGNSA